MKHVQLDITMNLLVPRNPVHLRLLLEKLYARSVIQDAKNAQHMDFTCKSVKNVLTINEANNVKMNVLPTFTLMMNNGNVFLVPMNVADVLDLVPKTAKLVATSEFILYVIKKLCEIERGYHFQIFFPGWRCRK